jgi:putative hemolysin
MINIEKTVTQKFPAFATQPELIRKPTLSLLRKLTGEDKINQFLALNDNKSGFEFIDQLFSYFHFNCTIDPENLKKIPDEGAAVIIANHPTGSLDGLVLLKMIRDVRTDIKVVADTMLMSFNALDTLLIADNNTTQTRTHQAVVNALQQQQAVILFPATDISRAGPSGIKDKHWTADFLNIARETEAPIIPVLISAKNSFFDYCMSFLLKPLRGLLISRELTRPRSDTMTMIVGPAIAPQKLINHKLSDRHLVKRLKKHTYKLAKDGNLLFITERPLAREEKPQNIMRALKRAAVLGETRDQNTIYLADFYRGSALIKEIGRLREYTFRKVGEGTGSSRDLDSYDQDYRHLTLWNQEKQHIVGAYRIGEAGKLIANKGIDSLYTASLYCFTDDMIPYLQQGLELGRSFVHPDYWGKASLDYLWQGIGAFLRCNPAIRYLLGPVSVSAEYPKALVNELVFYFQKYYGLADRKLATAYNPYIIPPQEQRRLETLYSEMDKDGAMDLLQENFKVQNCKIPVLFKQYTSLYEDGGIQLLAFSIDPDFSDCIDGLFIGDLTKLKPKKRERYIGKI